MKPEVGKILVSEPFLSDPNFSRSVVLIAEYQEDSTVGFVMNQKTDYTVALLMPDLPFVNNAVYQGGPVELESFHYIHKYPQISGSTQLTESIYWSGDFDEVIEGLKQGDFKQEDFMFFVGYSGWAQGQLTSELEEKAWILGELPEEYLINPKVEEGELWKLAISNMDGDDALLANSPINPFLN